MIVTLKYDFGEVVYLKTDAEQRPRIISEVKVLPGCVLYIISHGTCNSEHYDFEISTEPDVMITTTN